MCREPRHSFKIRSKFGSNLNRADMNWVTRKLVQLCTRSLDFFRVYESLGTKLVGNTNILEYLKYLFTLTLSAIFVSTPIEQKKLIFWL